MCIKFAFYVSPGFPGGLPGLSITSLFDLLSEPDVVVVVVKSQQNKCKMICLKKSMLVQVLTQDSTRQVTIYLTSGGFMFNTLVIRPCRQQAQHCQLHAVISVCQQYV